MWKQPNFYQRKEKLNLKTMLLTPKNNVGVDNTVNEMPKAFSTC